MGLFNFLKRDRIKMEILRPDDVPTPLTTQLIDLKNEANDFKRLLRDQDAKLTTLETNMIERFKQLEVLITGSKEAILERLQTSVKTFETHHTTDEKGKIKAMIDSLSIKEKKLFALLMQSGALTYQEIAQALNISPITARGLVHRILIEPGKANLFQKIQDDSGNVKIAIRDEIENGILRSATSPETQNGNSTVTVLNTPTPSPPIPKPGESVQHVATKPAEQHEKTKKGKENGDNSHSSQG